jgi:hypothetical protein
MPQQLRSRWAGCLEAGTGACLFIPVLLANDVQNVSLNLRIGWALVICGSKGGGNCPQTSRLQSRGLHQLRPSAEGRLFVSATACTDMYTRTCTDVHIYTHMYKPTHMSNVYTH